MEGPVNWLLKHTKLLQIKVKAIHDSSLDCSSPTKSDI